jgi:hypothetical protein
MPVDYESKLYGPKYDTFGVEGLLDPDATGPISLTVIDKTEGVLVQSNSGFSIGSSKPAALVRFSELSAKGLTRDNIKGRTIAFNAGSWVIKATEPKSNPAGLAELYLILEQA